MNDVEIAMNKQESRFKTFATFFKELVNQKNQ